MYEGTPRYLPRSAVRGILHLALISRAVSLWKLGETNSFSLAGLITCPEMAQKSFKHSMITSIWLLEASANKMRSSAKNK